MLNDRRTAVLGLRPSGLGTSWPLTCHSRPSDGDLSSSRHTLLTSSILRTHDPTSRIVSSLSFPLVITLFIDSLQEFVSEDCGVPVVTRSREMGRYGRLEQGRRVVVLGIIHTRIVIVSQFERDKRRLYVFRSSTDSFLCCWQFDIGSICIENAIPVKWDENRKLYKKRLFTNTLRLRDWKYQ